MPGAHDPEPHLKGAERKAIEHALADHGDCRDINHCERYRRHDVLPGGMAGVGVEGWKWSNYHLVDQDAGAPLAIGGEPFLSPCGQRFSVGRLDEMSHGNESAIAVWGLNQPGIGIGRLRLVDVPTAAFVKFVRWQGDDCVEFVGIRDYGTKPPEERPLWLAQADRDWPVHDQAPAACR